MAATGGTTAALALSSDLHLPAEVVTETLAIIANRGGGKSCTAVVFVEELHAAGQPVVILDPKGDWWGLRYAADGGPGLPFVIFGGDHGDLPLEPAAGPLLAQIIVEYRLSCVLDLAAMSKTAGRRFTMEFAEEFYKLNRDPIHVVVDEADVLIPQRASADVARLLGAMEDLAKRGRGRGIGMTLITQRAADVSKSVLDLMETLIVLRVTGPRTRAAIVGWIDDHDDDDPDAIRRVIGSLKSLQIGEAWVWSPGFLRILQRVQMRRIRTFDSHATPKPGEIRRQPTRAAEVDLVALGERISATMQRVQADDPKTLRTRIGELEREVARLQRLQREQPQPRIERIEVPVPVLDDELVARLEAAAALLPATAEGIRQAGEQIGAALTVWRQPPLAPEPPQATPPQPPPSPRRHSRSRPSVPVAAIADEKPSDGAAPKLREGARRMLRVLAAHHPMQLTRTQLGTLARVKHSGGTFTTYFGEMKRAGWIVEEDDRQVGITQAGLDHLGVDTPTPASPEEILAMYRQLLRAGARRMLDVLTAAYPASLSRDELADATEIAVSGGTFTTYLGHLRRNGLLEPDPADPSRLRASPTLFLANGARSRHDRRTS